MVVGIPMAWLIRILLTEDMAYLREWWFVCYQWWCPYWDVDDIFFGVDEAVSVEDISINLDIGDIALDPLNSRCNCEFAMKMPFHEIIQILIRFYLRRGNCSTRREINQRILAMMSRFRPSSCHDPKNPRLTLPLFLPLLLYSRWCIYIQIYYSGNQSIHYGEKMK